METCDKCGQIIKSKVKRIKSVDIWREINELLGLDFEKYEERIFGVYRQKDMLRLRDAIKKLKEVKQDA